MSDSTLVWLSGAFALIACSSAFLLSLQRIWLHKSQQRDPAPLRFDTQRDLSTPVADDAHRLNRLTFGTLVLTLISALNLYDIINNRQPEENWTLTAAYCAQFVSWLYTTVLALVSRRHKFPNAWGWILNVHLAVLFGITWCIAIYNFYEAVVFRSTDSWITMLPTVLSVLIGSDLLYTTMTVPRGQLFLDENGKQVAGINVASIFSFLYFQWCTPLINTAYGKQKLTDDDLPTLPPLFRGYNLYYVFGESRGKSLLKRIYLSNKFAIIAQVILCTINSLLYYTPAYFVNQLLVLIQSMEGESDPESVRKGFLIVACLGAVIFILGIFVGQLWYYGKKMTRMPMCINK